MKDTQMNMYIDCLSWIKKAIADLGYGTASLDKLVVEPTKNPTHGDVATNAALVLAKPLGIAPQVLASTIMNALQSQKDVQCVSVAGPGFINITFTQAFWVRQLKQMMSLKENFGKPSPDNFTKEKILVEYVSVNPTGPLHAGHGRNAILGDTIASLLAFYGHDVTREYYINDAGGQVDALSRSVYVRYREALGQTISADDFGADMYGADYLIPAGKALVERFGDLYLNAPESQWLHIFKEASVDMMMDMIREDLKRAGIVMDVYTSEKALAKAGRIDSMLESLFVSEDAYMGVLDKPKGIVVEDWEEKPQTLFKSIAHGDDVDRVIKKSNGQWTYFAGDAAYHFDKYQRGFCQMINVFGADHAGYLKRLMAVVSALTAQKAQLEIKVTQMVNFMDNGTPIRMSKRSGNFITFRDVIDEVGVDATRYMMVSRHQDTSLDFDFALVVAQIKDNPMFYIKYAHARIHSVIRHMKNIHPDFDVNDLVNSDLTLLKDETELAMIKMLATWPRMIQMSVHYKEPHRLANGLYDIAAAFHSLWNKGKENTELRFIDQQNPSMTLARLALIWQIAVVIKTGFGILGIHAIEEMGHEPE